MLGEAPSTAMLTDLVTKANAGSTVQELADSLATDSAFTSQFPIWMTATEFTTKVVANMFAGSSVSQADTDAAVDYIAGAITAGTFSKTSAVVALTSYLASADGAANATYGSAAQSYQNKVEVAEYYTITKGLGDSTAAERKAAIAGVTSEASSVTAEKTAADTAEVASTAVAGKTLTLTTGVDALTGGAGNDAINGVVQANGLTGSTTSPGDVVTGGAGTDTLSISVAGDGTAAGYTLQAVQTNAVENIHVTNFDTNGTGTTTIDTSLMSGVESVGLAASSATGDTAFSNLTAIKNAKMLNGSADLTLTYVAGTTGTADVQNLAVSAASAGSFSANGVETVAVTNSLTANTLTNITGSTLKAITVTGDQNFTMTGTTTIKGIDASANTGKTSLVLGAATHTVTTGAGDDTIDIGANLSAADKIQGGAGTDTLKVETAGTLNGMASATDVTAEFAQSGGFENIEVAASGTATLNIKDIAGVETVTANTNIRTITIASAGNHSDADVWSFTVNGTTYSAAAVVSGGNQAADDAEAAAAIALKINNDVPGATATSALGVVTVVNTSGGRLDISAVDDSIAVDNGTGTVNALAGLTVSGLTTQSLDIFNAGSVTARLADSSGDADVLNVNLKTSLADSVAAQTIDTLDVADTIETMNLNATGMKTGVSSVLKTITTLTSDSSLTTLNISGSDDLTIGTLTASKLATIDASTATGNISLSGTASLAQTVTTGSGNDTLVMAGNLTGTDVIDMGGNSAITATGTLGVDTVTTTGNLGSTVASMTPQISNAEAVTITGTANFIDGSSLTNVGALAFTNTSGATALTNMPAGTAIGLGVTDSESAHAYTVALADATGTEDALSLVYGTGVDASTSNTIVVAGVETLNVKASAEDSNNETSTLVLTNASVSTVNVTGGHSGDTTALGTLNKATTAVNAGANKSIVSFDASAGVGMTVSAAGAVVNVINLSTKADTVTLTGLLGTTVQDIDGGVTASAAASDTLNATLTSASSDFTNVGGFEVLNLTVPAALSVGFDATAKDGGLNTAAVVNVLGGNSNSTFTVSTAEFDTSRSTATALTVDASTFGGNIDLQFASDALDIFTTVKGGASTTDVVDTIIAAGASTSIGNNPTMSGVETLTVTSTNTDTDAVINLGNATGLTLVNAVFDTLGAADQIEIDSLAAGVTVSVTGTNASDNLDVGVAGVTGAEDALTIVSAGNATGLNLDAAGIEVLTISNRVAGTFDLAGVAPTLGSATTINVSGAGSFAVSALNTGTATINAAGLGGALTLPASARDTDALSVTGGVNNDSIAMENTEDVLDGGTQAVGGADTLVVDYSAVLGGITVDLTAADQIVTMDGGSNTAAQAGFENIDLTAFDNFGAVITATAGANAITGTVLADRITAGKGNDTINIHNAADINFAETINGGTGTDEINMLAATTAINDADFANMTSIETLTLANGTNTAVLGTNASTTGITTVTGGTGADAINVAALTNNNTIVSGGGAETIIVSTAANSTVTLAAAGAITTLTTSSVGAGWFNVTTFAVAEDLLDYNGSLVSDNGSVTIVAEDAAGIADIASINTAKTVALAGVAITNDILDGFIAGTTSMATLEAAVLVSLSDASGTTTATQTDIGGLDTALADASKVLMMVVDNEDTSFWYVNNTAAGTGGANVLAADEISLVGIIQGDVLNNAEMTTIVT
jgi:hypothetical protein